MDVRRVGKGDYVGVVLPFSILRVGIRNVWRHRPIKTADPTSYAWIRVKLTYTNG